MLNSKSFLTTTAALAMLMGAHSTGWADSITAKLAQEAIYTNGGDSSQYKVSVTNNTQRDVWVTYYKTGVQSVGQAGTQCIPPTKTAVFAYSNWAYSVGGQVRGERKTGDHCGGDTTDDSILHPDMPVYSGGTGHLTINETPGSPGKIFGSFVQ